ncbi:AraC family transcriptional regulator [Gracilibacillus oryzae]|uniref:AraC family transcriptional regulator n=1 Tax=Gracilibacillus oryzae TaxID=1672701 RepID=A0A7C8KPY8_9BACI|nr:helix-turn-helix domain-containing protein [Gracilibacillus oryzae]KAB8126364.1 AraC family transcriptional regulator [Gracilibacillus oryzae]
MRSLLQERTQLFYKYFLSYFIIFFIPFIFISYFVSNEATTIIEEEIITSNLSKLEQVKDISDTRIKDMQSIATNIANDNKMSAFKLQQPYESKLAIQQLSKYDTNNSNIDGLFIYIDDHPYIYTSRGTAAFDTYAQKTFDIKEDAVNQFRMAVQKSNVPVFEKYRLSSGEQVVSYIYPIASGGGHFNGRKVVFLLREKSYHHLVDQVLGDFDGANYIFDHNGNSVASPNDSFPVSPAEIRQLADKEQEVIHKSIGGENYSIISIRSDLTGWSFITAIPTNQFFEQLNHLQKTIVYILVTIAIAGLIIITIVTRHQYMPLKNLVNLLKSRHLIHSSQLGKHAGDELTSLRESILFMSDKTEKLHTKVAYQAPYVKDQLLSQLLTGKIENENKHELTSMLADVGVVFPGNYIFVVLVSQSGENADSILYAQEEMDKDVVSYGLELPDNNSYCYIVSLEDEKDQQHYVDALTKKAEIPSNTRISIGVGQLYNGVDKVNRSFVEAKAAMEYARITNQGSCIYFEKIAKQNNSATWFPMNLQVKLSQSLKEGDYIVADETITDIIKYIISIQASIDMTRAMAYDLINTMLKVIAEHNILYDVTSVKQLFTFQSIDELQQMLDQIAVSVCKEINQKKRNSHHMLSHQLMEYLQKEFNNPDLSLEKLSVYLNLSVPYASRFIKEQTGYTFTQIIWDMRMKACQRLLLDSSLPIKEIVKRIGYHDVANFTRKFKKEVGITPSQFRKRRVDTAL